LTQKENLILAAFSVLYTINIAVSNISLQLVTVPVSSSPSSPLFVHNFRYSLDPTGRSIHFTRRRGRFAHSLAVPPSRPSFHTTLHHPHLHRHPSNSVQHDEACLAVTHRRGCWLCVSSPYQILVQSELMMDRTYGDYYFTAWGLILTLLGTALAAMKTVVTNLIQTGGGGRLKLVSRVISTSSALSPRICAGIVFAERFQRLANARLARSTPSTSSCECHH